MPERILIVGSCAAGKSTLAVEVADRIGLPLVHLDQHYWRPGWGKPTREEWREQVAGLIAAPRWVMDGNYGGTLDLRLPRADLVVLLDQPRRRTVYRALRRRFLRDRVDRLDGSPERVTWEFLRWIWTYPSNGRVTLLRAIEEHGNGIAFRRLRNTRETGTWLAELAR